MVVSVGMLGSAAIFTASLALFKTSRTFHYYAKFAFFTVAMSILSAIYIPFMIGHPLLKRQRIAARPKKMLSNMLGVHWEVRGLENVTQDSGCVIVANHQSALDLLVFAELYLMIDGVRTVAKREMFYYWPYGLALWLTGVIFIDRLDPGKARATLNQTEELISKQKVKLFLYPEGTRNGGGKDLLPFKKGAFHLAIGSQKPLQPMIISRYPFLDAKTHNFGSGTVLVEFLPPIPTVGLTKNDIDQLIKETHSTMSEVYERLSKEAATRIKS